jgi:hypothetical protein
MALWFLAYIYMSYVSLYIIVSLHHRLKDQGSLKSMLDMDKTLLDQLEMDEFGSTQVILKDFQCHSTR